MVIFVKVLFVVMGFWVRCFNSGWIFFLSFLIYVFSWDFLSILLIFFVFKLLLFIFFDIFIDVLFFLESEFLELWRFLVFIIVFII